MMRFSLVPFALLFSSAAAQDETICTSDTNTFTFKVNLYESDGFHAGRMGHFYVEECGNITSPTLGIEIGETYTFDQSDVSNYFHPLGFAYFADGAHLDMNELEPTVSEGTSSCAETATCPAPMYFMGNSYLGTYSNSQEVADTTKGETDFGLDIYEPTFAHPLADWAGQQPFQVKVNFDDKTYVQDLFYFCHIHAGMSGRIKLLTNGAPINSEDTPELPASYVAETTAELDQKCGTYRLADFALPHSSCPETFVCDISDKSANVQQYSECLNAMNCAMFHDMTTSVTANSEVALFIHQMIPHHENAVNMAKALLKLNVTPCDDFTEDNPSCFMNRLLREIIASQNAQILEMRGILERKSIALVPDGCDTQVQAMKTGGDHFLRK